MFFMAVVPGRKRASRSDSPKSGTRASDSWWRKVSGVLAKVGPGIVTGAADDDPSGIATYSQAGAQFGFTMLWTLLFSLP
jgi:Mn2+/Fe2+ NRAMP family transporter